MGLPKIKNISNLNIQLENMHVTFMLITHYECVVDFPGDHTDFHEKCQNTLLSLKIFF